MSVEQCLADAELAIQLSDQSAVSSGEQETRSLRTAARALTQAVGELTERVKDLEEHPGRRVAGTHVKG